MRKRVAIVVLAAFALGVIVGVAAAKGKGLDSSLYGGKSPKEASAVLLEAAKGQTGGGSWENIGVGRVLYLSGDKAGAQAVFDRVTAGKVKKDDWIRIGRVYFEAGDWDKAEPVFQKVLEMDPSDDGNLAEIGAYYNLKGDRAKAEELFAKSFMIKADVWNYLNASGSYVGVKPQ